MAVQKRMPAGLTVVGTTGVSGGDSLREPLAASFGAGVAALTSTKGLAAGRR